MRMTNRNQSDYPALFGLIERLGDTLSGSTVLAAFQKHAGGQKDAAVRALETTPSNPWVDVRDLSNTGGDGGYATGQPNTVLLDEALARGLNGAPSDDGLRRRAEAALLRGVLHWASRRDWTDPASEPGASFLAEAFPAAPGQPPARPEPGDGASPPQPDLVVPAKMMGGAILDIARRHLKQKYANINIDYNDPDWKGAFDCAEYASYCAYRAHGILYGVEKLDNTNWNSYTGFWKNDVLGYGIKLDSWRDALLIPGAFLLRYPPSQGGMGHIGISLGDGQHIYEAAGKNKGVREGVALGRSWDTGVLLPGVLYDLPDGQNNVLIFKVLEPLLPYSPVVEAIENELVAQGYMTSAQADGIYNETTAKAVFDFQEDKGLVADGELGPETGAALGFGGIWTDADPALTQPGFGGVDAEILTLARTLWGEARGEPTTGQEAVANVIINRMKSPRYPNTISKVCLQPMQFSCWNRNDPNFRKIGKLVKGSDKIFDKLLELASRAAKGMLVDNTSGALHYHAKQVLPTWVTNSPKAKVVLDVGNHLFYTGIK